jgi:hypothetical protein
MDGWKMLEALAPSHIITKREGAPARPLVLTFLSFSLDLTHSGFGLYVCKIFIDSYIETRM